MRCFYINLDASIQRKSSIENNFAKYRKGHWSLDRISAVDVEYVNSHRIPGSIRDAEKACFLSHKKTILQNLDTDENIFILEDDAMFGRRTCETIENILNGIGELEWDIIFTDLVIPNIDAMANLLILRQKLVAQNRVRLLNPKNLIYAGATAYIINKKSKRKIYDFLKSVKNLDIPYDLFLRRLIRKSNINGYVIFPFATSLSEFSESSNIQTAATRDENLIWDMYRRMVWLEGNIAQHQPILDDINQKLGAEEKAFGILWAALASKHFRINH